MPKLEAPNASELAWIRDNVAKASAMAQKHGGDPPDSVRPSLAALDTVWGIFSDAIRANGDDPNALINTIGCAFGQYLVDTLALAWVVATDSGGTEIAVHGSPGDILVYPTNLVAKRWQSGERAFIVDVGTRVVADIEALRYRAPT